MTTILLLESGTADRISTPSGSGHGDRGRIDCAGADRLDGRRSISGARGGVSAGQVLFRLGDDDGSVVDIASRLTAQAVPGEVLTDLGTLDGYDLILQATGALESSRLCRAHRWLDDRIGPTPLIPYQRSVCHRALAHGRLRNAGSTSKW